MKSNSGFAPSILETPDKAMELVFDASGRFLVANDMVFEAGNPEPAPLGVEPGFLVAHPTKPMVAVLEDGKHGRVDFVELGGKRRVTHVAMAEVHQGAFDAAGKTFVVSRWHSHELSVFSLEGKLLRTVPMPNPEDTAPAVVFGPKDASLVAFTDAQKMVTLPLDGTPVERPLAKVKVLTGHALKVGMDRVLFHDMANSAMVSYQGEVLWTSRVGKEAVALVPGTEAIAFVRLSKGAIGFFSATDRREGGRVREDQDSVLPTRLRVQPGGRRLGARRGCRVGGPAEPRLTLT